MPKRRLQCGSCATVIKVSSRVQRPICPRCDTAHTFIKCGRGECGTLMCLPENVNHFSCPRCNVQLARPGHTDRRSAPIAVRCGNTSCDFLMTIPGNTGRFRCPRCQLEQLLPGTEEEAKTKARAEEETRQQSIKKKQDQEVCELCKLFKSMDAAVVQEVYDVYNKSRAEAFNKLVELVGSGPETEEVQSGEVRRLHEACHYKRQIVDCNIVCPLTARVMEDPVFAADGWSYEREAIAQWLTKHATSPVTSAPLAHNRLVPNHQLKAQIIAWGEYEEGARSGVHDEYVQDVAMATQGGAAAEGTGGVVEAIGSLEALSVSRSPRGAPGHGVLISDAGVRADADELEAGAAPRWAEAAPGLVASRVASFQVNVGAAAAGAKSG